MDFVKLGPAYSTEYIPTDIIEGYNSLIWTERFQAPGEFQMTTFDVDGMKQKLPEGTFVSHLETQEVMIVETHEINMVGEGEDAQPELTVSGRSASVILEHRFIESSYQKKRRLRKRYSATAACGVLLFNAIDNGSGADVTRGDDDPETEGVVNHYDWTTKDKLPNVAITEAVATEGETRWWQVEQGMLYPQLIDIMVDADLGLRTLRPILPNKVTVFTVKTALAERGTVVRTLTDNVAALRFEIYSGTDRTSGENSVQFSHLQGHLLNPTYLESTQNLKTAAEIMSGEIEVKDVFREGDAALAGWKRKTMAYDAGNPEIPPQPPKPEDLGRNPTQAERTAYHNAMDSWRTKMGKWKNKRANIVADFREEETKKALRELKKARRIDMFSGDISTLSPYVYKTHYNLGDTVMLFGDYGKSTKMLVAEYVRTEDANGDRGLPGLVAP